MIEYKKNFCYRAFCVVLLLVLALVLTGCSSSAKTGAEGDRQTTALSAETPAEEKKDGSESGAPAEEKKDGSESGTPSEEKINSGRAGTSAPVAEENSHLQVVTTIFPQYDFARHIAGDRADVTMLLKPGEEVHSYEPTPQDIKKIQNCDLFIYVGGENDVWVENILDSVKGDQEGPQTVRLLALVETYSEEHLEGMMEEKGHDHDHEHEPEGTAEEDHDHDHKADASDQNTKGTDTHSTHAHSHEEEPDEHVWTSPENCVILIEKLTEEFCAADPVNAEYYRKNGDAYRKEFEELDARYRDMAASAPRKTILFGDRFPFRYLAEELGLTCYAAFPGCSSESEPSAATIAFLIDKAAEEKLPVVFQIEFSNGNIARAISEAAELKMKINAAKQAEESSGGENNSGLSAAEAGGMKIQVLQLHSCHNITADEFKSGQTCLSLMTKNLEALRTALGAPAE
jgi:zinc transport system substrate-binding protein